MDLSTTYMGLKLRNPIIVSSSRLTGSIDDIKKCADYGAGAIVLKSLFEEQLLADTDRLMDQDEKYFWFPEAIEYINTHAKDYGVNNYLNLIREAKSYTNIPIIASINCVSPVEWPQFARRLVEAGADAIELNIAIVPFNESMNSSEIEDTYVQIVTEVKKNVDVPVAVKLGAFFSNHMQIIRRLCGAGVNAVVLFNRYYRPDIDIMDEVVVRSNVLSAPEEMGQPLRWVSLLSQRIKCDIAGNTGIHDAQAMIKMLLAGATSVQICSTLYNNGIGYIDTMLFDLKKWMDKKGYDSIDDFKGKVARFQDNVAAFERIQFMKQSLGD
jgi:dihydroorotate dehydrogenase (fumarate)